MKKKIRKKNAAEIWMGCYPNCIVKKKLYFNLAIVLQPCNCIARERAGKKNCIARERAGKKNCIAIVWQEKGVVGLGLYCNRKKFVLQPGCVV